MTSPDTSALARIRSTLGTLVPSERRVATLVLERPGDVVGWSTAELAEVAETSTATVIRACQSLGFRGFQHLRLEVARAQPVEVAAHPEPASGTFASAIDALILARDAVDADALMRATDRLRAARRIVLVGSGFSGPPLQDFALRLQTAGRAVEAPIDALAQQFATHALTPSDVCLALSYSGANAQTLRAATAAKERGSHVIAITSFVRSPLGRLAHTTISTGPASAPHDIDPAFARLAHTVVLHTLHENLALSLSAQDVSEMRHVVADAIADD